MVRKTVAGEVPVEGSVIQSMPIAVFVTFIALGLFILSTVYAGALYWFSPSRLFFYLIVFSAVCLVFALAQAFQILDTGKPQRILLVHLAYSLIVFMNPIFLKGLFEPKQGLNLILRILLFINIAFILFVTVLLLLRYLAPVRISGTMMERPELPKLIGSVVGALNWYLSLIILVRKLIQSKQTDFRSYLFIGYIMLAAGSLFDGIIIGKFVPEGRMIQGFYPGLLGGLVFFHIWITLSLSRSYKEREEESASNTHAMEESKKELMRMAYFDDMTARPNRKSFFLHLNHHLIEAQTSGSTKAVFLLDLDNFRDINDTFGYQFGDLVIRNLGEKIEDRFDIHDRLYRLYGNQFAIIWNDIRDRGQALDLARGVLEDLTSLVEIDDANLYMGVSLGAVLIPEDGDDVNEIFRRCESALAEAKRDKNTFFFYSSELEIRTRQKMSIVSALREAIKKDMFDVVYQPIVRSDGSLAEMEALIRSRHSALKDISPEVYIAVAESSGLIIPITWWLLERVAADSRSFARKVPDIRININMSPKILKSKDLVERIVAMNEQQPINGSLVGFEITEGAIIENVEQVRTNLRSLRERGFRISLDDFGTGYSSLSYIKNLPLDKIKIDKRFIAGISRDNRDEALINSIISIAVNLRMDLVAEGVEMPNQLAYLSDRGCDFFQGYLFSKPKSLECIIDHYDTD